LNTIDDLNAALAEAEEKLRALNLGVDAHVHISALVDANGGLAVLSFMKHGNEWGLYVSRASHLQSLLSSTRETRILSAHLLPQLLKAMKARVIEVSRDVDEAAEAARLFIGRFESYYP
jgi:hypothetical protein